MVQKKCIRAINGIPPWESCKPLFQKLKILTLPGMYILECAKFVRRHFDLFIKAQDRCPRKVRDPDRIVLPRAPRTSLYKKNCYHMCGLIYNKIPKNFKELPNNLFFIKLKLWLLEKGFYSINEFINT